MSRIDALIAELCPEGVEFRELASIFEMKAGKFIAASSISDEPNKTRPYPCYGGNGIRGYVEDFSHDGKHVLIGRQGALCGNVKRTEGRFYATEHAVVCTGKGHVDLDWAFHMLTAMNLNQYATKSAQPGLAVGTLELVCAPLPPLQIQQEVVAILDKFTKLEAELEAELEARRRQYQHYRDALLTFDESTTAGRGQRAAGARWATLGDLYNSSSGLSKSADQFGFGHPFLSFKTVFNNPIVPVELSDLVNTTEVEQARYSIRRGDVFVTRTSEDLEGLGMSCAALRDYPNATFNGFTKRLRPKEDNVIDAQFAAYFFRSSLFRAQIAQMAVLSTRVSLNDGILLRIRIPVPPLAEQARIVTILDRFDALVNDLSSGLPAEIAARRQQYAHYRDRLLTFREAA